MRVSRGYVLLLGLLLCSPTTGTAQEPAPQPAAPASQPDPGRFRINPSNEVPTNYEARRNALERLAITGTLVPERIENEGPDLEVVWRRQARNNLLALAAGVQGLYDLGGSDTRDDAFRKELENGIEATSEAARGVLEFINRGADVVDSEPAIVPDESLDERLLHLVNLYLNVMEPAAELINGDILDIGKLEQVRAGLTRINHITLALDDTFQP
jgi:hypothetical protein